MTRAAPRREGIGCRENRGQESVSRRQIHGWGSCLLAVRPMAASIVAGRTGVRNDLSASAFGADREPDQLRRVFGRLFEFHHGRIGQDEGVAMLDRVAAEHLAMQFVAFLGVADHAAARQRQGTRLIDLARSCRMGIGTKTAGEASQRRQLGQIAADLSIGLEQCNQGRCRGGQD